MKKGEVTLLFLFQNYVLLAFDLFLLQAQANRTRMSLSLPKCDEHLPLSTNT